MEKIKQHEAPPRPFLPPRHKAAEKVREEHYVSRKKADMRSLEEEEEKKEDEKEL